MTSFDTGISDMVDDMLEELGQSYTYRRGTTSAAVTLRMSRRQSITIETSGGHVAEVHPVDFIGKTLALPYPEPKSGDVIVDGSSEYEVLPTVSEKVFRIINPVMIRIHTKQIK